MDHNHCIDIIARELAATTHDDEFSQEDYPDISEDDWEDIVNLATQIRASLTPDPTVSRTAYQVLVATSTETEIEDTHPLDQAIAYTQRIYNERYIYRRDQRGLLASLYTIAGTATASRLQSCALPDIARVAYQAAWWTAQINNQLSDMDAIWDRVRTEYDTRTADLHGRVPGYLTMSDDDRAFLLLEEVGEVARILGAGNDTYARLTRELIRLATMACTWVQAILNKEGE